jgi:low temperature requirement protein LtrA
LAIDGAEKANTHTARAMRIPRGKFTYKHVFIIGSSSFVCVAGRVSIIATSRRHTMVMAFIYPFLINSLVYLVFPDLLQAIYAAWKGCALFFRASGILLGDIIHNKH